MRGAANCLLENAHQSRQSVAIQVLLELDKRDHRLLERRSDA
jgi:hypothetical protein